VEVLELKIAIIRKYEVGFSRLLGRRFRVMALFDLKQLVTRVGYYEKPIKWVNPFLFWKPLITEFKFPFLKRSLLTGKKVQDRGDIPQIIEQYTSYNLDMLKIRTV
jgi:hypothetical protein